MKFRKVLSGFYLFFWLLLSVSAAGLSGWGHTAFALSGPERFQAERPAPRLKLLPREIREAFSRGIPAEEFVEMTGRVPMALESVVEGEAMMIIQMKRPPVAEYRTEGVKKGLRMPRSGFDAYRNDLEMEHTVFSNRLESMGASVVSSYTTVYNGFLARVPYRRVNTIRGMEGVKALHPAPEHKPMLAGSVPLIRADEVRRDLGIEGDGIVIAVIDSGIDYTHKAFEGCPGGVAYADIDPSMHVPWLFPTQKVVGGYDFAGSLYDAGCTPEEEAAGECSSTPIPDSNPLDEDGHGTHVAATAAGVETLSGLAPGVAPGAKLMALKVFGREGTTHLSLDALEWAALHYQNRGTPHVINMSLGSDFGIQTGPVIEAANNAADLGIIVVASAGNSGDVSYITGSPATGDRVISVAAATSGHVTGPTVTADGLDPIIYEPSGFDGNTGEFSEAVEAPLKYAGSLAGAANGLLCDTSDIAAGALAGKIALIQRGTCTFSEKVNNAAALGAEAALIFNHDGEGKNQRMTMRGDPVFIPAGFVAHGDGTILEGHDGGQVTVSASDDIRTLPDPYFPADQIASFSSRGPRGTDSMLKPDLAAPGVGIYAAEMGTGDGGVAKSGTSMAAPHAAGVAALVRQAKPDWTSEQVKALMMNTSAPLSDDAPISQSGCGRVDARRAVETDFAAVGDSRRVSLNWGVVISGEETAEREKTLTVYNNGDGPASFDLSWEPHPASLTAGLALVLPSSVAVGAGGSETIPVTLELDMTQTPASLPSEEDVYPEEYHGWVILTPGGGGEELRVPYYVQPRPASRLFLQPEQGISDPAADAARTGITKTGPAETWLYMYPAMIYSPTPDASMEGPGDIRLFGLDFLGTDDDGLEILGAAFAAHAPWHVPQRRFVEFDLYIDSDRDGSFDYVNFNYDLGAFDSYGYDYDNTWGVLQLDLESNLIFQASPYYISTDFNSAFMEWYLPIQQQELDGSNSDFDYLVKSFEYSENTRTWPKQSFDCQKRPISGEINEDQTTASIRVNDPEGYDLSRPEGALLVDVFGDPSAGTGAQAHWIPLERRVMDDAGAILDSANLTRQESLFFQVGYSSGPYTVGAFRRGAPASGLITDLGEGSYEFSSDSCGSWEIRVVPDTGRATILDVTVRPEVFPGIHMLLLGE